MRSTFALSAFLVTCSISMSGTTGASAQSPAEFYKGKTLTLVVGYGTGGGFDVYARMVARHLGKHIPGQPSIVVQNMPGGGSLVAVNHLYNLAPKDGTAMAHFGRNIPLLGALGNNPAVKFEAKKLTWLGSSSSYANDAYILVVREDSGFTSIEDALRDRPDPLILGGSAEGSTSNDVPNILKDTIGLRFKLVTGYPDSAALFLAMERKETQGRFVDISGVKTIKPDWLRPGNGYRVLLQFGRATRHAEFQSVPIARELAKTPQSRSLIELAELPYKLSRPFAAPPGIPADRAEVLQKAFDLAHKDPALLTEADKLGLDISPVTARDVLTAIESIEKADPDTLAYLRKLFADSKG